MLITYNNYFRSIVNLCISINNYFVVIHELLVIKIQNVIFLLKFVSVNNFSHEFAQSHKYMPG